MKHHLNLTEKQALVTRYTGGETVSAICMETGISKKYSLLLDQAVPTCSNSVWSCHNPEGL